MKSENGRPPLPLPLPVELPGQRRAGHAVSGAPALHPPDRAQVRGHLEPLPALGHIAQVVLQGLRGILPPGRLRAPAEPPRDGPVRPPHDQHPQDPGRLLQVRGAAPLRGVAPLPRRRLQSLPHAAPAGESAPVGGPHTAGGRGPGGARDDDRDRGGVRGQFGRRTHWYRESRSIRCIITRLHSLAPSPHFLSLARQTDIFIRFS
jgi:hypothetical protein